MTSRRFGQGIMPQRGNLTREELDARITFHEAMMLEPNREKVYRSYLLTLLRRERAQLDLPREQQDEFLMENT